MRREEKEERKSLKRIKKSKASPHKKTTTQLEPIYLNVDEYFDVPDRVV